jgi:hypothetical protein
MGSRRRTKAKAAMPPRIRCLEKDNSFSGFAGAQEKEVFLP